MGIPGGVGSGVFVFSGSFLVMVPCWMVLEGLWMVSGMRVWAVGSAAAVF